MAIEIEVICRDCGSELDAEENNSGQIEVALCSTCIQRLTLNIPAVDIVEK